MNVLTSHAIIQSVRDTAIRFAGSEDGGKEWRAILTEIIRHLPHIDQSTETLKSQLVAPRFVRLPSGRVYHDSRARRFAGDKGDAPALHDRYPGLREGNELGNGHDVYEWFIGHDIETRHSFRSRQCAWFIERLRILGYTAIRVEEEDDSRTVEPVFLVGGNALRGTREAFEQSEMTWSTLVEFLMFVHEKSDWTTPLMPLNDSEESIFNIREAQLRSYENRINWCYRQILEESGVIDHTGFHAPSLVPNSWDPIAAIHELFNQERSETLEFEQDMVDEVAGAEETVEMPAEDIRTKKKRQLAEILSILEEKAEESAIGEGDYMEYSELLMSFHKTL
jgi:hypothetical protein